MSGTTHVYLAVTGRRRRPIGTRIAESEVTTGVFYTFTGAKKHTDQPPDRWAGVRCVQIGGDVDEDWESLTVTWQPPDEEPADG